MLFIVWLFWICFQKRLGPSTPIEKGWSGYHTDPSWTSWLHGRCSVDWTVVSEKKTVTVPFTRFFGKCRWNSGYSHPPVKKIIIKHPTMVLCWDLHIVGSKKRWCFWKILGWEGITWCSISAGDCTPGWGLQIREPTEEGELSATGDWCLGPLGALRTAISPVMRTWIFWAQSVRSTPITWTPRP